MSWTLIIIILLLGILLLIIEFFFIPGSTIVGILGGVALIAGIALAFYNYGPKAGLITLFASGIACIAMLFLAFKLFTSERYAVSSRIDSRVNVIDEAGIREGDTGKTLTQLRPAGKAIINDKKIEVFALGSIIDKDRKVKVVKIDRSKIYVQEIEPSNT